MKMIHLKEILPDTIIRPIILMQKTDDFEERKAFFDYINSYLDASIECHTSNMIDIVKIQKRDAYNGFFDDTQVKDYLEQADILGWLACIKDFVTNVYNKKED